MHARFHAGILGFLALALTPVTQVSATGLAQQPPPPPVPNPVLRVSGLSPFKPGCEAPDDGEDIGDDTFALNSEVEPYLAVDPRDGRHMIGVWQQDRFSFYGGARGLMSATSFNGGRTWTRQALPFSRCGGGSPAYGGNFPRVSDPWVSIGSNGIAHAIGLSFEAFDANAVLASRSLDGGRTWSRPTTLVLNDRHFDNDKESITADPIRPNFVYAVWDRLDHVHQSGPALFARSTDSGASWEPARVLFDPGVGAQTINNQLVVLPNGMLVDMFSQFVYGVSSDVRIVRSTDQGQHWSTPIKVADLLPVGAHDPDTGAYVRDGSFLASIAVAPSGELFIAWADARFSGGDHDGIALSRSRDGGRTWSVPVAVNGAPGAEAFEPGVHVRDDGTITVSYFDFRNNTSGPALTTINWLAHSTDGMNWHESAVDRPFDLRKAPDAGGLFVGDYQGLSSNDNVSLPFFAQVTPIVAANPTDVFVAPARTVEAMFDLVTRALGTTARPAATLRMTATFHRRVLDNMARSMHQSERERSRPAKASRKEARPR